MNKWIYMIALINIFVYTIQMAFIFIFYITSNEFLAHFLAHPPRIYYGKQMDYWTICYEYTDTHRINISCTIKIIEIVKWFKRIRTESESDWLLSLRVTIRRNPKLMDAFPFPDDSVIFLSNHNSEYYREYSHAHPHSLTIFVSIEMTH